MSKKIIVKNDISKDFMTLDDNMLDISLLIEIKSETKSKRNIDLSNYINYLSKEDKLKRRKEFIKIVSFSKNTIRSNSSLLNMLKSVKSLIEFSDKNKVLFFEDNERLNEALKNYKNMLKEKVNKKEISLKTANVFIGQIITFLIDCFGYEEKDIKKIFPMINERSGVINNSTILNYKGSKEVYTKDEYKKLLSILIGLSKHSDTLLSNNINGVMMENYPFKFEDYTYYFKYGNNHLIREKVLNSKSVFLLLAFIALTGSNLTPALLAKRKDLSIIEGELNLLQLTLTCNRKSKIQKHKFILKKSQKKFFDYIIDHSKSLNEAEDSYLFPYINLNTLEINNITEDIVSTYYKKLTKDSQIFINDKIEISARAIRATYASFFESIKLRSEALFNSNETAAKNYSDGNLKESNENLQNAMNIYTIALKENIDISETKENLIKVKEIDVENLKDIKLSSNGLFCVNSNESKMEQKFKRKLLSAGFETDNISCSNVLACFQCENAMLSDSFESVYLLLSLKNYLLESIYENECTGLFGDSKIVKEAINNINIILDKIKKPIKKEVNSFILKNGFHPLWQKL